MRLLVETVRPVAVPGMPAHTGVGRCRFARGALLTAAVQLAGRCHRAVSVSSWDCQHPALQCAPAATGVVQSSASEAPLTLLPVAACTVHSLGAVTGTATE